jgi:hypothetical protein
VKNWSASTLYTQPANQKRSRRHGKAPRQKKNEASTDAPGNCWETTMQPQNHRTYIYININILYIYMYIDRERVRERDAIYRATHGLPAHLSRKGCGKDLTKSGAQPMHHCPPASHTMRAACIYARKAISNPGKRSHRRAGPTSQSKAQPSPRKSAPTKKRSVY